MAHCQIQRVLLARDLPFFDRHARRAAIWVLPALTELDC